MVRFRANRKHLNMFAGFSPESQGQNLALSVICVPNFLESGDKEALSHNQVTPRTQMGRASEQGGHTTPCRMTGVTLHSHVHYEENRGPRPE